ncbi:MAG TPA: NAD-dependent epimerase/dehydratase family protein [Thermomicrobiales bacterium]|jgi:nucleoside-diphosphate-sugar epimerase|nr:NAD-dependent epimerase/dehydratase family protein [Thermomicrobiales bacterium]
MDSRPLHVVLGATGGTGSAIVRHLVARGLRVRAVSRGNGARVPDGVERLRADVSTSAGAIAACAGAGVVYHAAQPAYSRWEQEFPTMTEAVIAGATAAGARLVFADNLYMYGPTAGPMSEATPEQATSRKGQVRIGMARRLMEEHEAGRLSVAIGRSSDYFGPGGTATIAGDIVFRAALTGKTVRWPGPLDVTHQFNYLPDMARALVILGERPEADGQVWHLPAAEPTSVRAFLELVFAGLERPAKVAATSPAMLRLVGLFSSYVRESREISYQLTQPFVADTSRFQQAFGPFHPTPYPDAIRETLDWFARDRG